jgi:hypothetical protein
MRPRPENLEPAHVLGYLGTDKVLYCSRACATSSGQAGAQPVDHDEFEALAEAGAVARSVVCPVCGSEYPAPLAGEDDLSR